MHFNFLDLNITPTIFSGISLLWSLWAAKLSCHCGSDFDFLPLSSPGVSDLGATEVYAVTPPAQAKVTILKD